MSMLDNFTNQSLASHFRTPYSHPITLRDYQHDALSLMDSRENVSIRFPRQYGGTTLIILHIAKSLLSGNAQKIALISRNNMMGRDTIRRVGELLESLSDISPIKRYTHESIELYNGAVVTLRSSALRGHSTSYDLVYWDEVSTQQYQSGELGMYHGRHIRMNCNLRTPSSFQTLHRGVMDFSDCYVDLTHAINTLGMSVVKREYFGERFTEL